MDAEDRRTSRNRLCAVSDGRNAVLRVGHGSIRRDGALEALADLLLGEIAPDEDQAALARLALAPFALVIAVEHHVHALEHETLRIVLQRNDALAAQDVLPFRLHQVLDEREELVRIERLV